MADDAFAYAPAADHPGWSTWNLKDTTRFNGSVMEPMLVRQEGDKVRLRMFPQHRHTNLGNAVHGAIILSLIDISLFSGMRVLIGGEVGMAVTLDLSTQFIGPGNPEMPLDSVVEVLRETRQLVFLRGLVEQEDRLVAAFNGTVRKAPRKA